MSIEDKDYYRLGMDNIYNDYLFAIEREDKNSIIYKLFLNNQTTNYINNTKQKRIVIDFIAGMTDELFLREIKRLYNE